MKQTVANKELCEKELHVCIAMCCTHTYAYLPYLLLFVQEALEKKQADLAALEIACENKDEEIRNLDQSLSQMSIDKEEMERISMKLVETEEKLAQASKKKVCSNWIRCTKYVIVLGNIPIQLVVDDINTIFQLVVIINYEFSDIE